MVNCVSYLIDRDPGVLDFAVRRLGDDVRVLNACDHFHVTAALLAFLDPMAAPSIAKTRLSRCAHPRRPRLPVDTGFA